MTIVTLTDIGNGELHVHEIETDIKSTFDKIVNLVHRSSIKKAAYLVGDDGRMLDSYIK